MKPLLAIVTGRPGAGKSTLANFLAQELLLVSRDAIKEEMARIEPSDDLQQRATDAFFSIISDRIGEGTSLVAEAAFQHQVWAHRLEPFFEATDLRIIVCHTPLELARERMANREAFDPDRSLIHPIVDVESYHAPRLPVPTLTLDTSGSVEQAMQKAKEFLRSI